MYNEIIAEKYIQENLVGKTYEEISDIYNTTKTNVYKTIKAYKQQYGIDSRLTLYEWLKLKGKIKDIIERYQAGESMDKICLDYNVSERTVAAWLNKENVKIRDTGIISRIDQTIFNCIDSEIKAYTIGLITADGSVSKKGSTISITVTKDDGYILSNINKLLLEGNGNIVESHKTDDKPRLVLQFNGKHLKEMLATHGIVPNKTYILDKLSNKIPQELYHHYIRGLFDGDGVCAYYTSHDKRKAVRIGYCAHEKEFTNNYLNFLHDKLGLPKNKVFNTGGCWQCSWGAYNDIEKFYNYIYQNATIYLGRKQKKMHDYLLENRKANTEVN